MVQTIPFTFAPQSGSVPASELDTNFTAVQTSLTTEALVATGSTVDLGAQSSNNIDITGNGGSISSFGITAIVSQPVFFVRFTGTGNTIVFNATSMITPTGSNINVNAGDQFKCNYLGSGNWLVYGPLVNTATSQVSLRGNFNNLSGFWSTNTTATYTMDQIIVQNSSNASVLLSSVSLSGANVLNTAASGAGGLDTGSTAASTWYYTYVIYNGTAPAALMSLSATAPTLPAGYTYYGRIGSVYLDGSKNIRGFSQKGRNIQHQVGSNLSGLPIPVSGTSGSPSVPTWTAAVITAYIPPTAAEVTVTLGSISSGGQIIAAPNPNYGAYNSTSNPPPLCLSVAASNVLNVVGTFVCEQTNYVYYASSTSGALLAIVGYQDNL